MIKIIAYLWQVLYDSKSHATFLHLVYCRMNPLRGTIRPTGMLEIVEVVESAEGVNSVEIVEVVKVVRIAAESRSHKRISVFCPLSSTSTLHAPSPITFDNAMRLALCALRMHIHIPLGKGDDNAGLVECFVDGPIQLVNNPSLVMRPVSPAQQLKIQR